MVVADKNPLWNHAMHALADIDDLRHATVPHDRGERVRLLATHRDDLLTGEPMDGLLNGDFHRLIQILVITHEDPVRLGFRPWPVRLQVLAHDWPNLDFLVGTLERRQFISPFPCRQWESPVQIKPPLRNTGRYKVEPACSSFRSMFEPFFQGRSVLVRPFAS